MPDDAITTLSPRFLRELNDALRKIGGHIFNEEREKQNEDRTDTKQVRIGRTTTGTGCAAYPGPPANTFLIEFGKASFPEECGLKSLTFTPYEPRMLRFAHALNCSYLPEDTICFCILIHGQWYVISTFSPRIVEATLAVDLCDQTDNIDVANEVILPSCEPMAIASSLVTNPRGHRGPSGSNILLIEKACKTDTGSGSGSGAVSCTATEWQIFAVEKRKMCVVVDVENRESCLIYAPLIVAGEWCPADEPTEACLIVEYTDCTTTLPACDLSWSFAATPCCRSGSGA